MSTIFKNTILLNANNIFSFGFKSLVFGNKNVSNNLAFGIAYLLLAGLKPLFLQLQFNQFTDIALEEDWQLFIIFTVFVLLVGLIAGLLPATTLSRTSPKNVLQNLQNFKHKQGQIL